MPSVKKFAGDQANLKRFLTQIKIKINNKGLRLPTLMKRITYAGMSLTGKPLEWFQPYLAETQVNRVTFTNNKVKYMFSTWEGFCNQFTQIYKNTKEEETAT